MTVSLILAMAENGVIGCRGGLPWHMPMDLKRFKAITTGHTVVMGRKTFESIGKPLPNRRNVVLTRDPGFDHPGVRVANDIEGALGAGQASEEIFVIGGAEVFRQVIDFADRIYLTLVHAHVDGDTKMNRLDPSKWALLEDEFHHADDEHHHPFSFRVYRRAADRPAS